MEDEILKSFKNADVVKQIGSGGDFIVSVDDKIIFSKKSMEGPRFPYRDEISTLIRKQC